MDELFSCPFCGGAAGIDKTNYYYEDSGDYAMSSYVVSCRSCGIKTADFKTEEHAVKFWNRRAWRTCHMIDNGVELCCSECDRRHGYDDDPEYCMGCGAKVVYE